MSDQQDKTIALLETAILPALLGLLEETKRSYEGQIVCHQEVLSAVEKNAMPESWKTLLLSVDDRIKDNAENTKALETLSQVVLQLKTNQTNLCGVIERLQENQKSLADSQKELADTIEMLSARIELLTQAVAKERMDPALERTYQTLERGLETESSNNEKTYINTFN